MELEVFDNYEQLSGKAKDYILRGIAQKNNLLLCAATGGSPTQTYRFLAEEYSERPSFFNQIKVLKLDEWGGIPSNSRGTCESYLQQHLIQPLKISESRYFGFKSDSENPEKECGRIQQIIKNEGPIDICILGLGMNGHLALNEPADFLRPNCHVAQLSATTLGHSMTATMPQKPTYGLTLGMADILGSKAILMIIHGSQKKEIVKKFLSKKITPKMPASFLWLHPNVLCLVEKSTLGNQG